MIHYELITGPAAEPLTTAEAKTQLREASSDFDTQIDELIKSARRAAENRTRRAFITQTWTATLDKFPSGEEIPLAHPPIQSITSVTYLDNDGIRQTFASSNYTLDKYGRGFVSLNEAANWPSGVKEQAGSIVVTFVAGYGAASTDIPSDLLYAVRLLIEDMYNGPHPNNARDHAVRALIKTYMVR